MRIGRAVHIRRIFMLAAVALLSGCSSLTTGMVPITKTNDVAYDLDVFLDKLAAKNAFTGSVLVVQDENIVLNKGYGLAKREQHIANTPQTKFRIGSLTKQFTATAVLMLQEQGKIDLHDPVCGYMPDCPTAWKSITIHHLLNHTSGIPDFTDFIGYALTKSARSTPEQTIARFKNKPLDFRPGEKWHYSNSGYIVLGHIIDLVSGASYENFLKKNIFTPLEMRDTGYDHNEKSLASGYKNAWREADMIDMSIPFAAGGLYSTTEDLYKWDRALHNKLLLSEESYKKMFTAYTATTGPDSDGYGYGWTIGKKQGRRVYAHAGEIDGFVSLIARFPDDKVSIILLSNQQNIHWQFIVSSLVNRLSGK